MQYFGPLIPHFGSGQALAVTAAGADLPLFLAAQDETVSVTNLGPNTAYVRVGEGLQASSVAITDFPIAAGQTRSFGKPPGRSGTPQSLAAICAATETASIKVITGQGGV